MKENSSLLKNRILTTAELEALTDNDLVEVIQDINHMINRDEQVSRRLILQKEKSEIVLIERYKPLILNIMKKFRANNDLDISDYYQEAVIGFLKGIRAFDTKKGNGLSAYVRYFIIHDLCLHQRQMTQHKTKNFTNTIEKEAFLKVKEHKKQNISKEQAVSCLIENYDLNINKAWEIVDSVYTSYQNKFVPLDIIADTESGYSDMNSEESLVRNSAFSCINHSISEALKNYSPLIAQTWISKRQIENECFNDDYANMNDNAIAELWFEHGVMMGGKNMDRKVSGEKVRLKIKEIDNHIACILSAKFKVKHIEELL